MKAALDWRAEGPTWPHHAHSRFVQAAGIDWHVQRMGSGPTMLLLHGTGASTHSWRALMPLWAREFDVIAIDLPGHAFTGGASDVQLSLAGMARGVAALLARLGVRPEVLVGHSAGAAVAAQLVLFEGVAARQVVGINAALLPLPGLAGRVFPPIARLLAATPLLPGLFSWRAQDPQAVRQWLARTGSPLDAQGEALYARLVRHRSHAAGALGMMARWQLEPLLAALPRLGSGLSLIVGSNDLAVPPSQSIEVCARVPGARRVELVGLGHLAHEERPLEVAAAMNSLISTPVARPSADP